MVDRLLPAGDVAALLGLTEKALRNRLYRNDGTVPTPLRLGDRTLRWAESDVAEFIDKRPRSVTRTR